MSRPSGGGPPPAAGIRRGRVLAFDAERGLGTVTDEGGRSFEFHCTAVADGSRRIDPGTPVVFTEVPAHRGQVEATALVALPPGS